MNKPQYFSKKGKPAVKLYTVNVVEYADETLLGIRSFADNEAGNKRAGKLFAKLVSDYADLDKEDLNDAVEDGVFEQDNYQVFISHGV